MNIRTVYVFLYRRPQDLRSWQAVYESRELAEAAPFRTSAVVKVDLIEGQPVNVPEKK